MTTKKNVLIAGGAGFIGSHLADELRPRGYNVVILDNFCTGDKYNIGNHTCINADISKESTFQGGPWLQQEYDEIWNCACPASPVAYRNMPLLTLDTCYLGTKHLLEFARIKKAKYIHLSTSEIYGCTTEEMSETNWGYVNSFGPRACYDEGKRIAETLIYEYQAAGWVDARIFRLFNTYGPRMQFNDGRVIPNFIIAALTNRPLYIYGSSRKTRTFCYVDDVIETMIEASKTNYNKPLNIGTAGMSWCTLETLADMILKLIPESTSKVITDPYRNPTDDPVNRRPVIDRLKMELGTYFDAMISISMETGLNLTIKYFRDLLKTHPNIISKLKDENFSSYKTPKF